MPLTDEEFSKISNKISELKVSIESIKLAMYRYNTDAVAEWMTLNTCLDNLEKYLSEFRVPVVLINS